MCPQFGCPICTTNEEQVYGSEDGCPVCSCGSIFLRFFTLRLDRGQLGTGILGVYVPRWMSLAFINIMNILT